MTTNAADKALTDLLRSLFDVEELRRFLYYGQQGSAIDDSLPGPTVSALTLAADAVRALRRHGVVDASFFDLLLEDRPLRAEEINRVRELYLPKPGPSVASALPRTAPKATPPKHGSPKAQEPGAIHAPHNVEISRRIGRLRIGILTALPKECAAVRLMLKDEVRWSADGLGASRTYYLGRVPASEGGVHEVAVALLTDMGNNSAAISATRLFQHFPTIRHVIMCGIAGGIPRPGNTEHDVRLGDIVVSSRGGVVQYDLIKERPDGSEEPRHAPRPPGAELLEAVRHLSMEAEGGHRPWVRHLARGKKLQAGVRPLDDIDARGLPIIYPPDPMRRLGIPRVFEGKIAAANNLLKNPAHRDYLGVKHEVKAIEMEGSGVADAAWSAGAGYLVVRGICDYCDENKGDAWQGAAAVAAAAYTRAVIAAMPLETKGDENPHEGRPPDPR